MDLTPFDAFRYLVVAGFGAGVALMVTVNVIAFKVLRPPKKLGFLWWHVTSISLSFLGFGIITVERVVGQLGNPPSWRSFVAAFSVVTFTAAQAIIFKVERERLIYARASKLVAEHPDLVYDPESDSMVPAPYAGYDDGVAGEQ